MIELKPLIYFFVGTTVVFIIYILIIMIIKNLKRKVYKRWTQLCNSIVNSVVYDDDKNLKHHEKSIESLLIKKTFRKIIKEQILLASQTFSGKSKDSLKKLYLQLQLEKYAIQNIDSKNWHIKAKAIQEIGIMKLDQLHEKVYENTNHQNELVRAEAQIAIIKLIGFEGLKFLETLTNPISEWYQMILQRELSYVTYDNFNHVDVWLHSKNYSVVEFALKLVDKYHLFDHYDDVVLCIKHESEYIRKQAIKTITKIFNNTTSKLLISVFDDEVIGNKKEIIKSLQSIGTDDEIPFLINQLNIQDVDFKIIITRTIAKINPSNFDKISDTLNPDFSDMNLIVSQIKEEVSV